MIVPGSAGIRLHLNCLDASSLEAMQKRLAKGTRLESFECPLSTLQDLGRQSMGLKIFPVAPISSSSELEDLARARDKDKLINVIPQFSSTLSLSTDSSQKSVMLLIKSAVEMGFAPRGVIRSAWKSGNESSEIDDDDDENLHASLLGQTCTDMADAGCGVICFSDDLGHVTRESLRSAVEESFGLDIDGEAMMERLSVRLYQRTNLIKRAIDLGVTRFDLDKDQWDL